MGSGVLGPVFRAHDDERDRLVAVKVLRLDLTPELADDVGDDLQALVGHWPSAMPGLVRPVRAGVEQGSPWLAQEFAPGEGLDAILRRRTRPSVDEVVAVISLIADALDAAAADGWTHGALHPRDILVTQDLGGIAITGVGIAHVVERAGFRAPRRRPYVAPERVAGHGWDSRADLYSLAVITLDLIGTRRASSGGHLPVSTVLDEAGLDIELWSRALTRALAEDPTQRFQTAREFADALDAACSSEDRAPRLPLEDAEEPLSAFDEDPHAAAVEPLTPATAAAPEAALEPEPDLDPAPATGLAFDVDIRPGARDRSRPASLLDDPLDDEAGSDLLVDRADADSGPEPIPFDEPADEERWKVDTPQGMLPPTLVERSAPRPYGLLAATLALGLFIGFLAGAWFMRGGAFASAPRVTTSPGVPVERAAVADEAVVVNDVVPSAAATSSRRVDPTPGVLRITSSPSGARVTIDGRDRGTTPLVVRDLSPGTYRLGVSRQGFDDQSSRVTVTAARPDASVALTLPRVAPVRRAAAARPTAPAAALGPGTMVIATRPAGARVFVDGRAVGTSPVTVPNVAPGSHQIRLELPGHRPWTTAVEVTPNQTRRVSASLDPTGTR